MGVLMGKSRFDLKNMSDVAMTGLITAFCHAVESRSAKPILHDPKAESIAGRLAPMLVAIPDSFRQHFTQSSMFALWDMMLAGIALRARKYDEYARNFAAQHKECCIINLGCGLDARFWRIDDGYIQFYDLDLPVTIALKRRLVEKNSRYHLIGTSVLDHQWLEQLAQEQTGQYLFLAEGLFMYLPPEGVHNLILALQARFPGSELLCDVVPLWAVSPAAQWIGWLKGWSAQYQFGVRHSREFEAWGPGLRFIEEWCYLDEEEPRLGLMRLMYRWKLILRDIWTVRYVLGSKDAP